MRRKATTNGEEETKEGRERGRVKEGEGKRGRAILTYNNLGPL